MKSRYCTQSATEAFEDLIKNINARYILFSYNNMATKGNGRSNAKISDEDIMRILQSKGTVKVFSENYKAFQQVNLISQTMQSDCFCVLVSMRSSDRFSLH